MIERLTKNTTALALSALGVIVLLAMSVSIVPETFSYTLSELWAAGIPVLATRLGAFGDRIVDGENGWLFPAGSVNELLRCMVRVLETDPRELDRMGQAGFTRITERHAIDTQAAILAGSILSSLERSTLH